MTSNKVKINFQKSTFDIFAWENKFSSKLIYLINNPNLWNYHIGFWLNALLSYIPAYDQWQDEIFSPLKVTKFII